MTQQEGRKQAQEALINAAVAIFTSPKGTTPAQAVEDAVAIINHTAKVLDAHEAAWKAAREAEHAPDGRSAGLLGRLKAELAQESSAA